MDPTGLEATRGIVKPEPQTAKPWKNQQSYPPKDRTPVQDD